MAKKITKEVHAFIAGESYKILEELSNQAGKKKGKIIEELLRKQKMSASDIYPVSFKGINISIRRVSTGIKDLDDFLDGGIPSNFLVVVTGDPGTGKTLLGCHFLASTKEKALLFVFQENFAQLAKHCHQIGIDLAKLEEKGLLYAYDMKSVCVEAIVEEIVAKKPKRVVIDSVASLHNKDDKLTAWYYLVSELKKQNIACLMIMRGNESGNSCIFENRSDGVIHIEKELDDSGKWKRNFLIKKMRATCLDTVKIGFSITSNGIVVKK